MTAEPAEDLVSRLRRELMRGTSAAEEGPLRALLSLSSDAQDLDVAKALVRAVAVHSADAIQIGQSRRSDPREAEEASRVTTPGGASYLVRLTSGASEPGVDLEQLNDARTLLAVLRAGTLFQRRAAARRLGELVEKPKHLSAELMRTVSETLVHLRDVEIAYELSGSCAKLPGATGRQARANRREWSRLVLEVSDRVASFWDGMLGEEPVDGLHADERAQLLARVRDLPLNIAAHLSAVIENAHGLGDRASRRALIDSLRFAGDPRLVPALRSVLQAKEPGLVIPAGRALGAVDDPRVHGILRAAYEQAVVAEERVVLAGALARVGDVRGMAYVRETLQARDEQLLPYAVEAITSGGSSDDVPVLVELLTEGDELLTAQVVKALGKLGDSRALVPLTRLKGATQRSALRAEIEDAEAAILARMELLGEEPAPPAEANEAFDTAKMAAIVKRKDPATVRFRARWHLWVGHSWLLVGALYKAVGRFEAAGRLRPEWVAPVAAMAVAYARRDMYAQALSAFRRAMEIDRGSLEEDSVRIRLLAQSFLRRAEDVEEAGRLDIACGLLEEVLALDLRKAPSGLRFALSQRHESLRVKTS